MTENSWETPLITFGSEVRFWTGNLWNTKLEFWLWCLVSDNIYVGRHKSAYESSVRITIINSENAWSYV